MNKIYRIFYLLLSLVSLYAALQPAALALNQADRDSIYNDTVWYKANESSSSTCSTTLVGGGAAEQIFNFFVSHGFQPWQAAGIVGNMAAESGLEPERLQGTSAGTVTPAESLSSSQLSDRGLGWGIVQWTPPGKMINTFSPTSNADDLGNQLTFLLGQLDGTGALSEKSAGDDIKATKDVENATAAFEGTYGKTYSTVTYNGASYGPYNGFERPKDPQSSIETRINKAKDVLASFGSGDTSGGGSSTCAGGGGAIIPPGTPPGDSSTACDPRTRDIGIYAGYQNGSPVQVRLCSLPNLPCGNEECNNGYGIKGADGHALLNSTVSKNFYNLVEAAKTNGITMYATSTFRTMQHQQALCAANSLCSSGDYTFVAKPGTSNHQMGYAVDFGSSTSVAITNGDQWFNWLSSNAARFGIYNYPKEAWHWSPTGN